MLLAPIDGFTTAEPPLVFQFEAVSFEDVDRMVEELAEVELVVAPLIGSGFDAFDVIDRLGVTEFRGRLRVIASGLADPALVLRELRAVADPLAIKVELVEG